MKIPEGKINKNIILVEITGDDILYYDKHPEQLKIKLENLEYSKQCQVYNAGLENLELTLQTACIFDTKTERYSDTSVYKNKKGNYIKKQGKRYYINDFK
jgi:hypothetical protein